MSEIIIDKNAKQITFTNNGIGFSQFGIANEILDLLEEQERHIKEADFEIERLNNIINESAEEILKELEENHHLSYGVALAIRQKLLDYKELKGSDKE